MARVSLLYPDGEAHRGMWVMGPRERTPKTHLRRLTGVESILQAELRTRNGTTEDAAIAAAHSLHRFNDIRYQGATTVLYKAGVSLDTGYDGTPLEFDVSEPRVGTAAEYLFVSGGGKLRKVETDGTVSQWGIDPPEGGNWDAAVGTTGENEEEVTVGAGQTTPIIPTDGTYTGGVTFHDSFNGAAQNVNIETEEVLSASGSAYCSPWNIAAQEEQF